MPARWLSGRAGTGPCRAGPGRPVGHLYMPLLQGLARLLELLPNWFSVTLGAKLVDHLGKKWLNPEKVAQTKKTKKQSRSHEPTTGET